MTTPHHDKTLLHSSWRNYVLFSTIAIGCALLYLPTLSFNTVDYDDPWLLKNNTLLTRPTWNSVHTILFDFTPETRHPLGAEYLPVRDLSVMLDHMVHGSSYRGFHATQVVLYALICFLVGVAVWKWIGSFSLALSVQLIFGTHPLHVESVAWLSERKGLLCAVGVLIAAILFRRYCLSVSLRSWVLTASAILFSVGSKAISSVTFLFLAALALYARTRSDETALPLNLNLTRSNHTRNVFLGWLALAILNLIVIIPTLFVGQQSQMIADPHGGSRFTTFKLMIAALGHYLEQLALVSPLAIAYPLRVETIPSREMIVGILLIGVTLWVVIKVVIKSVVTKKTVSLSPMELALFTGWIFFLPVSHIIAPLQNIVADRYMLLPSLGWCLAIAILVERFSTRWLRLSILTCIVALQCAFTWMQIPHWKTTESLLRRVIEVDPQNSSAMARLSTILAERSAHGEATRLLEQAIGVDDEHPDVLLHRALMAERRGDRVRAIELFRRAAQAGVEKAQANLALLLETQSPNEALMWARRAVENNPYSVHAQRTLGIVALRSNHLDEAFAALRRATQLDPSDARNHYNVSLLFLKRGNLTDAKRHLEHALTLQPSLAPARDLLKQIERHQTR